MSDVQLDYLGQYGFNAREVASMTQDKFVTSGKKSYKALSPAQLKEVYDKCKAAVIEADKDKEVPAPENPE